MMSLSACCHVLSSCPSLTVALPSTASYTLTEASYWSLQESSLHPSCIVKPTTAEQAAEAVSILVSDASCHSTPFAIKSQGHAPAAGFANIGGNGVTFDLTDLRSISLSSDHSTVSVGAGASWVDVYSYLDPYNLTAAGGRNGLVGVGGLTLGGGISYFSPQVGFTCDTVQNYEVVAASGRLVNANATHNPDLFRALKGGANNFGMVTRFDLSTVPYTEILGGTVSNNISELPAMFAAFANIAGAPEYDVHASIVLGTLFNSTSKQWSASSTPIYTLPELRPKVYEELLSLPNITDDMQLRKLGTFSDESATPPLNWAYFTATLNVSADLLNEIQEVTNNTLYDFEVSPWSAWDFAFEPLPSVFVSHGAGHNSLGLSPSEGNAMILLISALWPDSSANNAVHAKAAQLITEIENVADKMSMLKPFVYANYAGYTQHPIQGYGEANVRFMEGVSTRYDSRSVFQKKVPGGFKLPFDT